MRSVDIQHGPLEEPTIVVGAVGVPAQSAVVKFRVMARVMVGVRVSVSVS
jgi:hypothetical protein